MLTQLGNGGIGEGKEKETGRWDELIWKVESVNKEAVRDFEAIGVFGRFQMNIKFFSPSLFLFMFKNFKL